MTTYEILLDLFRIKLIKLGFTQSKALEITLDIARSADRINEDFKTEKENEKYEMWLDEDKRAKDKLKYV